MAPGAAGTIFEPMRPSAEHLDEAVEIFSTVMGIPRESVDDAVTYASCSEWSSLRHLELVDRLEHRFGIRLDEEDVVGMASVAHIKETIVRYLAGLD